ncbi:MAG: tRNA (adenosine(37)-N6)-threonylcarbamoyltransferase complex ATPase subunit type 1 TsaE [candidate division WOR-3 bacterium]|nr:tRNA (adenosine(37)-N6)-threonylcarbamoyltransferase complex ATPase subunit type 1 TsaE [candidate division WOR-3 bacterium]MCX7948228.1 tRNA (adenosine(37)-N6)-threonylcarbamoyltransferase complex ATPase subunit type 1 TsaE [candidate division WOR-3 bacterium]MDW8150030.1 tRNA (adenosine(37)-N6)-threonylcarbamoyltransferase complex ATPase subunit type 1 TsaE [candidate division WOR-3 bacterium]
MIYISKSEEETENLGFQLARSINLNNLPIVIRLFGDLGSGKTTFARGFLKFFNIKHIRSPSFVIVIEYKYQDIFIYHMDFYRLSFKEVVNFDFSEILKKKSIVLIEWCPKEFEFQNSIDVYFEIISENERTLKFML